MSGLFLDPGLRKTSITLGAFRLLRAQGMVRRMLVVAPIRVAYNVWPSEVKKWAQFQDFKVCVLHGKEKTIANLEDESFDIYTINPEGLQWLLTKDNFKRLDAQMFVLDESSKFKNTQTKRFKLLKPYLPKFHRRVILTGTPAPRSYLDLFGQVFIIDLGRALGQYITHYRNKYFDPSGFGGFTWKLKDGADKEIQKAIKPYVMRMEAEDYIDIPKLVELPIWVDLPPDAREIYDEMEDELIAILEGGEALTAPTAAAARNKCVQIAGGAIYKNRDGLEVKGFHDQYVELHDAKLEALGELMAELQGTPLIIFYWHQHELVRIRQRFGDIPNVGEGSLKKGKEIENAWNRNELPFLLANPASVGHGLNLQEGNAFHCVWFTLPDDFDAYDQAIRRLRRSGNTNTHVFAHRILARNTVDIAKVKMLQMKHATQKDFLDSMKSYRPRSKK